MEQQNTQTETTSRRGIDIEVDFNHEYYTADAICGMLFSFTNENEAEIRGIESGTVQSATYAAHCAVRKMNQCFQELLNQHFELLRAQSKPGQDSQPSSAHGKPYIVAELRKWADALPPQ